MLRLRCYRLHGPSMFHRTPHRPSRDQSHPSHFQNLHRSYRLRRSDLCVPATDGVLLADWQSFYGASLSGMDHHHDRDEFLALLEKAKQVGTYH